MRVSFQGQTVLRTNRGGCGVLILRGVKCYVYVHAHVYVSCLPNLPNVVTCVAHVREMVMPSPPPRFASFTLNTPLLGTTESVEPNRA